MPATRAATERLSLEPAPGRVARQFVLKLHSRCNLGCTYCYVYTMADQRWRTRPVAMPDEVMTAVAGRLGEHLAAHRLERVEVVLHGGEPLLAGPERITRMVTALRSAAPAGSDLRISVQTNAVLLDRAYLDLFGDLGVRVGVSLDGDRTANDRHRLSPGGRSSYDAVHEGLALLSQPRYRPLFNGLLCTLDLRNDPVETYRSLLSFDPPAIDFLLPHGNWSQPPPGRSAGAAGTPYADWLGAVFDQWYAGPGHTRVRMFESILSGLIGGRSYVEGLGMLPADLVVIETDGGLERSDILGSAYEGAAATGLHVRSDRLNAVLEIPDPTGADRPWPGPCRSCSVRRICGGGLAAHRYQDGDFDHTSVYCPDLFAFITHVRERIGTDLDRARRPA